MVITELKLFNQNIYFNIDEVKPELVLEVKINLGIQEVIQ